MAVVKVLKKFFWVYCLVSVIFLETHIIWAKNNILDNARVLKTATFPSKVRFLNYHILKIPSVSNRTFWKYWSSSIFFIIWIKNANIFTGSIVKTNTFYTADCLFYPFQWSVVSPNLVLVLVLVRQDKNISNYLSYLQTLHPSIKTLCCLH